MGSAVIDMINERLEWLQKEQDESLTEYVKQVHDETAQGLIATAHLYMSMEAKFLNKLKQKITE